MTRSAVSLFSGCGGGALAAQDAGYEVAACVDFDKDAVATLRAAGLPAVLGDTTVLDFTTLAGEPDLLIGGPPCQSFSQGGLQRGSSDPRNRIPDFVRAVEELRPRVFIMENVRGLTFPKHRDFLEAVLASFPPEYTVDHRVLNAADYGVAQTRQRVFIVGRLDGEPVWPAPTHAKDPTLARRLWVPVAAVLAPRDDLPAWAYTRPSTTVVGSFRPDVIAAPGWRKKGDPPRQDTPESFATTTLERAAIQGFPIDWPFAGSCSSVSKQLGNACPPALLSAVIAAQETFAAADPWSFKQAVSEAWDLSKGTVSVGDMLTEYSISDLNGKQLFLSGDGLTGYALEDGDLQSLFNQGPSGRGSAAVADAINRGALTLDCLAPFLPAWYEQHGFVIDRWEDNWTPGGPPVAYMIHAAALEVAA